MKKRIEGSTLLEILLALILLGLIALSFSGVMLSAAKINYLNSEKQSMYNWAQTILEYLKNPAFDLQKNLGVYKASDLLGLKALVEQDCPESILNSTEIEISRYQEAELAFEQLYKINVRVSWGGKSYELSTLVYQK